MRKWRKYRWLAAALICLSGGFALILLGLQSQFVVILNGEERPYTGMAISVGAALDQAGVVVHADDRVQPPLDASLLRANTIVIRRAVPLTVVVQPAGTRLALHTAETIPGNLLRNAGLLLFPHDRVTVNGLEVEPDQPINLASGTRIELLQAQPVSILVNGTTRLVHTSASSVGQALLDGGYALSPQDRSDPPMNASLLGVSQIRYTPAVELDVEVGDRGMFKVKSSAPSVGEALAGAGVSLQGLDRSIPPEDQPLPPDGLIQVIRVREDLVFLQTALPYGNEYVEDPGTELDQSSIVTPGQYGVQVSRERVMFEGAQQVALKRDAAWEVSTPVNQLTGYGSKPVIRSIDTPYGTLEYWRKMTVYVTSYAPCPYGETPCYFGSSSGMPVQEGLIATYLSWYRAMKFQRLYVPGYGIGTIGDVGRHPDGIPWIDVAYTNETYIPWGQWETVYFLAPIPSWFPVILPAP